LGEVGIPLLSEFTKKFIKLDPVFLHGGDVKFAFGDEHDGFTVKKTLESIGMDQQGRDQDFQ